MRDPARPSHKLRPQSAAEEGEARYRAVLDSALDCIIWTDESATIEEFNPAAERTFRISRAAALGKDLSDTILPPASRSALRNELFSRSPSHSVELVAKRVETKVIRAGGAEFPAEVTVTRVAINEKTRFIVYVRDLTAQQLSAQALVHLAAIVESSQDAIIGTDLEYRITSWNKGAELMYGYTASEAIAKNVSIVVPPDRIEEALQIRRQSKTGSLIRILETVRVAKNGHRLDVSVSISPVLDSDGAVIGASAIERDITVQKQTEKALRRASDTSIYASPMPIIAVDTERRVTMWNPAAQAVFGWSEEEVLGKSNPVTLRGGTEEAVALHKRALAGEILTGIELHGRKQDGTFVAISLSAAPLFDGQGKIKGIIGFLADITNIKRAEEALRSAEQKYRTIFENAIEGIYQATPQGQYISANPSLARMFAFSSPAEMIEARTDIRNQVYVHPEMHEEFVSTMRRNGIVQNFEFQAYRKDGTIFWVSENARSVRDHAGQLLYFEGTVQDITERRELEQQLRLMQKIEAVGRLAGGVAHDFNNLLMAVSSYAELLQTRIPEKDPNYKYLEEIMRVVERGGSLTQGLLTFSRKQVISLKVFDLNIVIKQHIEMLRRLLSENIELKFTAGRELGHIRADSSQVEQLVMNLVINARDAISDGGQILIETENADLGPEHQRQTTISPGQYVMLSVSDNGCGMDTSTKTQIFEPFFTTKGQGKGTGLGLTIVSDIVRQSGGQLFLHSEVGVGTTFKIYFPRIDAELAAGAEETLDSSFRGSETILLVEDEDTVRHSIAEYLKERGYKVFQANGGPEALELVSEIDDSIDLVLTDVIMPKMSGRDLSDQIKQRCPGIKVVFMSGYSNNLLSTRQVLDSGHVFLQKPVRLSALAKCLRETLERGHAASAR